MTRRCALLASLLVLGLLGVPSSALAAFEPSPHAMLPEESRIPPNGKLEGFEAGVFEDACGVAIPPAGPEYGSNNFLYVSDYYHDQIQVYWPYGGYHQLGEVKIPNIDPGNGPCGLAVNRTGTVYVNTWHENVLMLTPNEAANVETPSDNTKYSSKVLDSGGNDTGVALDPATENVYVDNGTYLSEYTGSGTLIQTFGMDKQAEYFGISVSDYPGKEGYVYVADAHTDTIKVFNPAANPAKPIEEINGAGTPQHGFDYLGESTVTVDDSAESPSFGHVYVVDNLQQNATEHPEVAVDEFNARGAYRGQVYHWIVKVGQPPKPVEHRLTASEPTGIALDKVGNLFITDGNDEGSKQANENDVGSLVYAFQPTFLAKPLKVSKAGNGGGVIESGPAGINCGSACEAEYTKEAGEIVTLRATPDAHSAFVKWTGGCSGTEPVCHVTIEKTPVEVIAEFVALPQKTLTLSVKGSGSGTVTSQPVGIECKSGTCAESFNEGSTVTLVATPEEHNKLVAWSGSGAAGCSSALRECQVTMSEAKSVEAEFAPIPQKTLSVAVSGQGSVISEPSGISCPSNCGEQFDEERVVTLVAAPSEHQELAGWKGCTEEPAPHECVVAMNGQDRSVSAEFTPIRRHLSIAIVGQGSVSADHGGIAGCTGSGGSCSAYYLDGEVVKLTATPAPGYVFAGWSGGVCGGTGACEIGLEADVPVVANFVPPPVSLGPPPAPPRVRVQKASVKGTTATLTVKVSTAGKLSASAKGLSHGEANVGEGGGTAVLHLRLTKAGLKALERGRGMSVVVGITFAPAGGGTRVVTSHVLKFKAGHAQRHGGKRH